MGGDGRELKKREVKGGERRMGGRLEWRCVLASAKAVILRERVVTELRA